MDFPIQYIKFNSKRAFGIELEVNRNISLSKLVDVVRNADPDHECYGTNYYQQDHGNNYWHVKFDRSCGSKSQEGGWEIASYKASGVKDLVKVSQMGTALKEAGAEVNDNCGYHIHAEIADFNSTQAATLVANWMKLENIIMEMLPKNRHNNAYCKMLREAKPVTQEQAEDAAKFWLRVRPFNFDNSERRVALNMCNYALGGIAKRTAELRLPEGTLDPKEIKNWARLYVNFIDFVKKQEYPGDVTPVQSIRGAATVLGLHHDNPFFLLSKGLYETKTWFLSRIVKYSTKKDLRSEAQEFLNYIIPPDDYSRPSPSPTTTAKPDHSLNKKNKTNESESPAEEEYWHPYE